MPKHTILLVDDESHVLTALRRALRREDYEILTANSGPAGLELLEEEEREVALVLSDQRMPKITGVEFLRLVKNRQPDAMRIMLTGYADTQSIMDAINKGEVYRFITKPWDDQALRITIRQALEQYDLVMENRRLMAVERELLEKTLSGSVGVLTEILSLINPAAFSRALRTRRCVRHIVAQLQVSDSWQFEVAVMLSQIGCITLPSDTLEKIYARKSLSDDEQKMFSSHPSIGGKLLANIPRLEPIARMIEGQQRPFKAYPPPEDSTQEDTIALGSQILKVALDFDQLVVRGLSSDAALVVLRERKDEYNPQVVAALENLPMPQARNAIKKVMISNLDAGMVIAEDIRTKNGFFLVPRGQKVTDPILERVRNFARGMGVVEPIRVFVPRLEPRQETAEDRKTEEEWI